jgi:NADP-dependent 3-hydroxy acid dehydrogenase YdfG
MDITDRAPRTWVITEAGSGTALALTRAAVKRGDNVVALVGRADELTNLTDIHHGRLRVIAADIGDQVQLQEAVTEAVGLFGRIDVVANTAFYDLPAAIEEISDIQAQAVFERTVLGTLNVLRATLPVLRAQRSGHVLQASPSYSQKPAPGAGMLTATIYATEGLIDVLAAELAPLGIHVTLVETPPTTTQVISGTDLSPADSISDYDATVRSRNQLARRQPLRAASDNAAVDAVALLAAVDAREAPPRLVIGKGGAADPALHAGTGAYSRNDAKAETATTRVTRCPTMATTRLTDQR